jgi:protein involved in polysaccharide export with SLBB domain
VTLSQLLGAAGGLTENANINNVEVIRQKVVNGVIVQDKIDIVNLTVSDAKAISLSGKYNINVPSLINDVSTGVVTLSGEIQRPGDYMIARDESLHSIIERAGGFTNVSYPLGAVFTREAIKESQKESNSVLASQLEQAILMLSQSDREGAAAQIEAVLLYARQLRAQEVKGRLTVNVSVEDKGSPVYLQEGDTLFIPKRPAHVSVIGSVQKDTIATYSRRKTFRDYLSAAGGQTKIADIKQTFVLLPNGESIAANVDTLIPPGSVIVVPPKTDYISALGFTDIVSRVLGNIATSILAINNVQ